MPREEESKRKGGKRKREREKERAVLGRIAGSLKIVCQTLRVRRRTET